MTFWKTTWAFVLGNILSIAIIYGTVGAVLLAAFGVAGISRLPLN